MRVNDEPFDSSLSESLGTVFSPTIHRFQTVQPRSWLSGLRIGLDIPAG